MFCEKAVMVFQCYFTQLFSAFAHAFLLMLIFAHCRS